MGQSEVRVARRQKEKPNCITNMIMVIIAGIVILISVFLSWLLTFSKEDRDRTENIDDNVFILSDEALEDEKEAKQIFQWPQQAATLKELQKRRKGRTLLSVKMKLKLKDMDISRRIDDRYEDIKNIET